MASLSTPLKQRVQVFLTETGAPPSAEVQRNYEQICVVMQQRRHDDAYWTPLTQLLRDLVDSVVKTNNPNAPLPPEARLLALWNVDELAQLLRAALPHESPPDAEPPWHRLSQGLSPNAFGLVLLLSLAASACYSYDTSPDTSKGSAGAKPATSSSASTSIGASSAVGGTKNAGGGSSQNGGTQAFTLGGASAEHSGGSVAQGGVATSNGGNSGQNPGSGGTAGIGGTSQTSKSSTAADNGGTTSNGSGGTNHTTGTPSPGGNGGVTASAGRSSNTGANGGNGGTAGKTSGTAGASGAALTCQRVSGGAAGAPAVAEHPLPSSCCVDTASSLWQTIDASSISSSQKQTLYSCFAQLNATWCDGLVDLFRTATPEVVAQYLSDLFNCCLGANYKITGDFAAIRQEIVNRLACNVVLYKGITFPTDSGS